MPGEIRVVNEEKRRLNPASLVVAYLLAIEVIVPSTPTAVTSNATLSPASYSSLV